jgi:hypothetical protein
VLSSIYNRRIRKILLSLYRIYSTTECVKGSIMFIEIPKDGYWLNEAAIKKAEEMYDAKYMGYWCTKRLDGKSWNESPVDVFYQPNPDVEKGHKNYFGLFVQNGSLYITDATSAFSVPIVGSVCEDGEVIVSRYRHDYVEKKGAMIDGGRDYTRTNMCKTVKVIVDSGEFIIEETK